MRKVEPLSRRPRLPAWVTGIRRSRPDAGQRALISFDEAFGLVKINPLATWSDEQMQDYINTNGILVNPLVDEGLSVDRLQAVTVKPEPAPTRAAVAGRDWPRPNAGCTPRDARISC